MSISTFLSFTRFPYSLAVLEHLFVKAYPTNCEAPMKMNQEVQHSAGKLLQRIKDKQYFVLGLF